MKFPSRQQPLDGLPGVSGTARVDRRTSAVVRRLRRGDIAVIDHLDLDRSHAEALADALTTTQAGASVVDALQMYEQRRLDPARRLVRSGQSFSRSFSREAA